MPTLKSNKLALNNPIPENVQNDFLSDYCPIVYCIEVSDGDMTLSEKFYNWDELVEFVKSTPEIYEPGSGVSEFKIWTEMEDFSDFYDYKKKSDTIFSDESSENYQTK